MAKAQDFREEEIKFLHKPILVSKFSSVGVEAHSNRTCLKSTTVVTSTKWEIMEAITTQVVLTI
jgi:hypothetical protein